MASASIPYVGLPCGGQSALCPGPKEEGLAQDTPSPALMQCWKDRRPAGGLAPLTLEGRPAPTGLAPRPVSTPRRHHARAETWGCVRALPRGAATAELRACQGRPETLSPTNVQLPHSSGDKASGTMHGLNHRQTALAKWTHFLAAGGLSPKPLPQAYPATDCALGPALPIAWGRAVTALPVTGRLRNERSRPLGALPPAGGQRLSPVPPTEPHDTLSPF